MRQVDAIRAGADALRTGDRSRVHPTRVAVRRLRSTLRTMRGLLEAGPPVGLDAELRWWAAELGAVRDRQVLTAVLEATLSGLPDRPAAHRLEPLVRSTLAGEIDACWGRVQSELEGARYRRLLADLEALTTAGLRDRDLRRRLERARAAVVDGLRRAAAEEDPARLHAVRRAAKRARYAAEAAGPALGPAALAQQQVFERMQEALGGYQDLVVAEMFVADLAGRSAGRQAADLGLLRGNLRARAEAARQAALGQAEAEGLLGPSDARVVEVEATA